MLRSGDVVCKRGGAGFGSFDDWGALIGWCELVFDCRVVVQPALLSFRPQVIWSAKLALDPLCRRLARLSVFWGIVGV